MSSSPPLASCRRQALVRRRRKCREERETNGERRAVEGLTSQGGDEDDGGRGVAELVVEVGDVVCEGVKRSSEQRNREKEGEGEGKKRTIREVDLAREASGSVAV
jgi:hypothetical protein